MAKKIYINGRFITQNITGVQRYAHEIVKWFDIFIEKGLIKSDEYEFILVAPKKNLIHLPELKNIKIKQAGFLKGQLWEQFNFPFFTLDGLQLNLGNTAPVISLLSFFQRKVVTLHDLGFLYYTKSYNRNFVLWYRFLTPLVIRFSNRIIAVSEAEKRRIVIKFGNNGRIIAIQNGGLDEKIASSFNPISTKEKFILYAGSLNTKKNIQGAVEAFNILYPAFPDFKLVVVGASEKSFSEVKFDITDEVRKNIVFAGRVSDQELFGLYNRASCFVFPSYYEASPFPPLEAMALGCPVASTNIDSLQERCGDAAIYFDPANSTEIASKIKMIIGNDILAQELQAKGYQQAKTYTWENCTTKTLELIRNIYRSDPNAT